MLSSLILFLAFWLLLACVKIGCWAAKEARYSVEELDGTGAFLFAVELAGIIQFWISVAAGLVSLMCFSWLIARVSPSHALAFAGESFCFFLPALAANQAGAWTRKLHLPGATIPVSRRFLSDGKTWGAYYGIVLAIIMVFIQGGIPFLQSSIVNYRYGPMFVTGSLMGLGAVWGDHLESFIKRKVGIVRGEPWWPWDAADFAIGATALSALIYHEHVFNRLIVFLLIMIPLHPAGNFIGFKLGLRDRVL